MKKIPTIFKRNLNKMSEVLPEPHPACDWVFSGEGVATRKYDGTCCLVENGKLYKRREVKKGKLPPPDFVEVQHDEATGKAVGWVPVDVDQASKEDRWHVEAFVLGLPDGTYELLGPKIQGNPEGLHKHILMPHADAQHLDAPRTFDELKEWMIGQDIEGVVWHHPDGRMAKIKLRDFGLKRNDTPHNKTD